MMTQDEVKSKAEQSPDEKPVKQQEEKKWAFGEPCRHFLLGQCTKTMNCRFVHPIDHPDLELMKAEARMKAKADALEKADKGLTKKKSVNKKNPTSGIAALQGCIEVADNLNTCKADKSEERSDNVAAWKKKNWKSGNDEAWNCDVKVWKFIGKAEKSTEKDKKATKTVEKPVYKGEKSNASSSDEKDADKDTSEKEKFAIGKGALEKGKFGIGKDVFFGKGKNGFAKGKDAFIAGLGKGKEGKSAIEKGKNADGLGKGDKKGKGKNEGKEKKDGKNEGKEKKDGKNEGKEKKDGGKKDGAWKDWGDDGAWNDWYGAAWPSYNYSAYYEFMQRTNALFAALSGFVPGMYVGSGSPYGMTPYHTEAYDNWADGGAADGYADWGDAAYANANMYGSEYGEGCGYSNECGTLYAEYDHANGENGGQEQPFLFTIYEGGEDDE